MTNHDAYFTFFQQINPGSVFLTPNRRLAATLHKLYQQYQLNLQNNCWQTPDILPLSSWLQRLWKQTISQEFANAPLVLNSLQEQFIWENIVLKSKESTQLLQITETAEIVKSAWNLLNQWQVDLHHPYFNQADDYLALQKWIIEFTQICTENQWLDLATLPNQLIAQIENNPISLPSHITLIGFTELSPQLKKLLVCCEKKGSKVSHSDFTLSKSHHYRMIFPDQEKEIESMARWAKTTIAQHPEAKIACVIPSLEQVRDRVMQIFSQVFAEKYTYTVNTQQRWFNISAGKNLLHYPIINTALQLLALHKNTLSTETWSYLLASPFLGEAEIERFKRAHFDRLLRQANVTHINLLQSSQKQDDPKQFSLANTCPHLAKRLRQFFSLLDQQQTSLSYSEWAKLFTQLLTVLGWPGERSLNSEEYQVVENWLKLLSDFATLDQVAKPVHIQQALHALHKIASKTVFQSKTPEAPIQVLGLLEAASIPFDYLWVASMDDISWPPPPKPNPFIPKRLQRELQMPHATAERELIYCQQLTQQFKQSAPFIMFSHAEKNDGLELQASALIRDLTEMNIDALNLEMFLTPGERIFAAKNCEILTDDKGPIYTDQEKIHGGVSVIKQQALCPFKAFAEWRLHARELEKPLPGFRAKDRGTITHKILEMLWNRLQDYHTLIQLMENELTHLVQTCIDEAFLIIPHSRNEYTEYLSLEKKRLHKLIMDWLQVEKSRDEFKVMIHEKVEQITIGQLKLSVRIDRIDHLSDGKKLIIDYKTGKNNDISHWFGDRPEEPQLPLYLLLDPENTVAITFAQVSPGENCFKGVSHRALEIKGIKLVSEVKKASALSWEDQLLQWNVILTKLSDDFCQGIAKVDPKESEQTCLWCVLKPFCRINEEIKRNDELLTTV